MQEIKTEEVNFPFDVFSSLDYESHVHGQKSYNGVAIISKKKLDNVKTDIIKDKLKQSRIISAEVEHKKKKIKLINIYTCLLYTSPSPRDSFRSRMPSSA